MRASDPVTEGSGLALGHAQKWIAMSITYAVGGRAPGFAGLGVVAHVPIDRVLLDALKRHPKFRPALARLPPGPWSKLRVEDEQAYETFQKELRRLAAPLALLVLEFRLWHDERLRGNISSN